MLGIVGADLKMNDVKALYWCKSPIGDALADLLFALARAGVLEEHPDDQTLLRTRTSADGGKMWGCLKLRQVAALRRGHNSLRLLTSHRRLAPP